MRVRAAALVLAVAAGTLVSSVGPVSAQSPSVDPAAGGYTLTLLHTNDARSALLPVTYRVGAVDLAVGGAAAYASVLGRETAQAESAAHVVISLAGGDPFLASAALACSLPPAPEDTPLYDAAAQRLMGFDALVLGSHDFDLGPDVLRRFVTSFIDADGTPVSPFVSANLDFSGEKRWRRLLAKNGLIDGPAKGGRVIARSAIVDDVSGKRIGVVGATTPALPALSWPRKVTVAADLDATASAVQAEVDRLTKKGIDTVILLGHLGGVEPTTQLVSKLRDVDIAVASGGRELLLNEAVLQDVQVLPGETQPAAGTYPMSGTDADGRFVPVVTTPGGYRYVGRLDVRFDGVGQVVEVLADRSYPRRVIPETQSGSQVLDLGITDAVPPTQDQLTQVAEPLQACFDAFVTTPVAASAVELDVTAGTADPFTPGVRTAETSGGDLVADALLAAYDTHARAAGLPARGPDNLVIAAHNGGGIGQGGGDRLPVVDVAPAPISRLDTLRLLPFGDALTTVDGLTAADVDAVLEQSCARYGRGGFLQVAGVAYTCDLTRASGDQAIAVTYTAGTSDPADDIVVVDAQGVVGDAGPFRLVTTVYTATGGDGNELLATRPATRLTAPDGTPVLAEQALREHLASFPVADDTRLATIPADDPRYASSTGEGRITVVRP